MGYTAIGLVGISLVAKNWHWYSDLPLGIYLGLTFGNIIAPVNNNPEDSTKDSGISLLPVIQQNYSGVQFIYNF